MNNNDISSIVINIIINIIIGIVIGVIIGYNIMKDVKYIGPNSNDIVKKTYIETDGRQYKLIPNVIICPINYSMGKLHDPMFKESH